MIGILILLALAALLSGVMLLGELWTGGVSGFTHVTELRSLVRPAVIGGSLILGIYSKALYDEMMRQKEQHFSLSIALRRSVRSRGFWTALLLSPIVLLAFYPSLTEINNRILLALFAYENGFFFRAIFVRRERELTDADS